MKLINRNMIDQYENWTHISVCEFIPNLGEKCKLKHYFQNFDNWKYIFPLQYQLY